MSIVLSSTHTDLLTPRVLRSGSLSGMLDSDWETSMVAPCGSRELRRSLSHTSRTHVAHCTSAAPLPSSQQLGNAKQAPELQGCNTSKSQAYDHKPAANMLTGCHAFKSHDSLPGYSFKAQTRLPMMRSWAVHAAYRSEFAQEIEAQQTPRHRSNAPLTPRQGFGIASTPRPILTKPAVPRKPPQQDTNMDPAPDSSLTCSSLSGAMSDEVASSPHTPRAQLRTIDIPKHLIAPPPAPVKKRKCERACPF